MRRFDPDTYLREVLGPFHGSAEAPGIFERYLLEPGDEDDGRIDARLREVKALWDRHAEHTKYGELVRLLLGQHAESALRLGDAGERARLATQAAADRATRAEATARALSDWEQALEDWVAQHGGLDPAKRAVFERAAALAGVDQQHARAKLDAAPVPAAPQAPDVRSREHARRALAALAQDLADPRAGLSLFHAIGLGGVTLDGSEIEDRYRAESERNLRRAHGHTQSVHANVLGQVKLLLIDGDPRAYVEGLMADVREALAPAALRAAASDGAIDAVEAEQLVQQAVERGLTTELARRVLTELAQEHGVPLVTAEPVDYVACPACNQPHPRSAAAERCRRCGVALHVVCPREGCATRNDAVAARCSACGADLRRYATAMRMAAGLGALVRDGRPAQAEADLAEVRDALGDAPAVAEAAAMVESALASARASWRAAEAAIGERRLFAARAALGDLRRTAADVTGLEGVTPADRLGALERRLAEVEALLERGRRASGRAREDAFAAALQLAADADEAEQELAQIAPAPPGDVRVACEGGGVVVTWSASPSPGVRYEVVRSGAAGGRTLTAGAELRVEDETIPSGVVARYAVVAVRGASRSPAVLSEEAFVAREVADLAVAGGDGEVRLAWSPVGAGGRVVVEREVGGSEQRTIPAGAAGLCDRDVVNGGHYAYRVRVEYVRPAGDRLLTPGRTVFGQPAARPQPVTLEPEVRGDGAIVLGFAPPEAGTVVVLRCTEAPALEPGADVAPSLLAELGEQLPLDGAGARDDARQGLCWYLPVTVSGGTGVAGAAVRHLALPAIEGVRAIESGASVRLTWTWPPDVRTAVVVWRRDRQPTGPDDPAALRAEVRLGTYRDTGFAIEAPGGEPLFATVYPAARVDRELIAAAVAGRGSRVALGGGVTTDVRYRVRRSGLRRRRLDVAVLEPPSGPLPGLLLVARSGDMLPRDAGDGDVLARLGADGPRELVVDLAGRERPLAVRLFLDAAGSAATHRVLDPAIDELMIG